MKVLVHLGRCIYEDIVKVIKGYKHQPVAVFDTGTAELSESETDESNNNDSDSDDIMGMGVTDTTGSMGRLGKHLQDTGRDHRYCTDHNFHQNAIKAYDRKFVKIF